MVRNRNVLLLSPYTWKLPQSNVPQNIIKHNSAKYLTNSTAPSLSQYQILLSGDRNIQDWAYAERV